jgi:hypothetical protein
MNFMFRFAYANANILNSEKNPKPSISGKGD